MAIIYSYPAGTPSAADNLLGTQVDPITEENKTVQFGIGAINSLATQGYLETTVTLTNAQWIALPGTDVQLVATPGADKLIKVLALSMFFDYATANFTFPNALSIGTTGDPITNIQGTLAADNVGTGADRVFSIAPIGVQILPNQGLVIGTVAGATGGGGSVQVKIRYQVLDVTAF